MSQSGPGGKVANRLVVLSSAAVLAVYAAGYTRTQSAAEQLNERISKGRSVPQRVANAPQADPAPAPANPSSDAVPATRPAPNDAPVEIAKSTASVATAKPVAAPVETSSAPTAAAVETKVEPAPVAASTPAPVTVTQPTLQQTPQQTASQPVTQPPPAAPAKVVWKDGTYYGWGTSRHGDIQAAVVIEGGRILSATISECQTRYPCDYIAHLPPQVAQRQSADVDSVSRATESADAFYFAVTNALVEAQKGK